MSSSDSVNLNKIRQRAEQSLETVRSQTGSLLGRLYTSFTGNIWMPEWAKEHVVAARQLQLAAYDAERKGISLDKHTIKLLEESKEGVRQIANLVNYSEYLNLLVSMENEEPLFKGQEMQFPRWQFEWTLNLSLLRHTYNRTTDPELKKQLSFLALQYLAKAAPITAQTSLIDTQLGLFQEQTYHREYSIFEKYLNPKLNQYFLPRSSVVRLLTDTKDLQEVLQVFYSVISLPEDQDKSESTWAQKIIRSTENYLKQGDFSTFLEPPLIFDFTEEIGGLSLASNNDAEGYQKKIQDLDLKIERSLDLAVKSIKKNNPEIQLSVEEIKSIIRANITAISRHEITGVGMVNLLPVLSKVQNFRAIEDREDIAGSRLEEVLRGRFHMLEVFLNRTGTRLGAVHGRHAVFEHYSLDDFLKFEEEINDIPAQLVEYAPKGRNILYFPEKTEVTKTSIYQRLVERFKDYDSLIKKQPHLAVLGKTTLSIFEGLMNEIPESQWKKLNDNPDTREIVQTTLFRFMQHLATAENAMPAVDQSPQARAAFFKGIELAQSEITTLLSLFSPFDEKGFEDIYKAQLQHVPDALKTFVKVGIGKSAMNVFAGVNSAVARTTENEKPERAIGKGSYFEEVEIIGSNRTTEAVLSDASTKKIDLYIGEFNHNINIDPSVHHYDPTNIIGEVDQLLKSKPDTERMTVAVDQTIDFVQSPKVKDLLQHFESQIKEGKLNFVFFRSGQKFDMLGMDNYYGSPFYVINNGDTHWEPFNTLADKRLFQTDPLSMQWFSLANKYSFQGMEDYRSTIFRNTRSVLNQVPKELKPDRNPLIMVSTASDAMEACFIDIKFMGGPNDKPNAIDLSERLAKKFQEKGQKLHSRESFGFPHANYTVILATDGTPRNLRINPGLDPLDAEIIVDFLNDLANSLT